MGSEEPSPQPSGPEPIESVGPVEPDVAEPGVAEPGVAVSVGDSRWSVAQFGWKSLVPDLSDEAAGLLAEPIVVSVEAPDDDRAGEDDEEDRPERYPAPADPCASAARYGEHRPGFLAPAGLRPRALARHRV
jgi:hypothetical protein